jgi:hypothetical protein
MSQFSTIYKLLDIQNKILWEYISNDEQISHSDKTNASEESNEMGFHITIITVLGIRSEYAWHMKIR